MFTGIIETLGEVTAVRQDGENVHFNVKSLVSSELKIDQSVSHNGVCLTVVALNSDTHTVTAIKETLDKTNLSLLKEGDMVNLERAMKHGDRFDGHMVQGHVDGTAILKKIKEVDGSWEFHFKFSDKPPFYLVDKGSVCIDGVSLTVVKTKKRKFHVAIIPYTFEHTLFHTYQEGRIVNIEFDIIGKYVQQYLEKVK